MGNKRANGKKQKATQTPSKVHQTRSKNDMRKPEGKACMDDLGVSLAKLGLRIRKVTADGNCFFRACSDQIYGIEHNHVALRHEVVNFMQDHEADFAPYIEDDEPFATYCKRMKKDGCWAGQQEQVSFTRLKGVKICVHQQGQPTWTIAPDYPEIKKDATTIHLSYHDGEHYNSVRLASDMGGQAATPILVAKAKKTSGKETSKAKDDIDKGKTLKVEGGHSLPEKAEADLARDPNIEEGGELRHNNLEDTSELGRDNPEGKSEDEKSKNAEQSLRQSESDSQTCAGKSRDNQIDRTKRPTRNGNCPCGSTKKYKNCCLPSKLAAARRKEQDGCADGQILQTLQLETIFV